MIDVFKITNSILDENTYFVVWDNNCLIIDPGFDFDKILTFIDSKKVKVLGILLTHGHFDHIASCKKLQNFGYKIYISKYDKDKCLDNKLNVASSMNMTIECFNPDYLISNEDNLVFNGLNVKVLHTPGHSKGGLSFVIENHLFSGDTLFEHGYGRYDLQDGNFRELISSLKVLLKYVKQGFILHPGH